jgi:selenocysteine lyase/cysteine desulfurase
MPAQLRRHDCAQVTNDAQRETDEQKVARLRELLPATSAGIYLDTAEFGPLPAETAAAMREADDWELRVGRATVGRDEDVEQRVEEARAVLAALVVADSSEIVLTAGVDAAIALAARIDDRHDPLLLDASLMAGAVAVDASVQDVDFVAFACDKWLLGPEQTAGLWIGPRARSSALSVAPSSGLSRTAVLGLARSVGWIEMYVGLEWAYARTAMLATRLRESLTEIPAVAFTARSRSAPAVVCFHVERWPIGDLVDELRRRVFAIVGVTQDGSDVRASVGWFNTENELAAFCGAVREIAASTPDTIPRRLPLLGQ